jgi:hypothetical protein
MKRLFAIVTFGLGAAALGGCPVYGDSYAHRVCNNGVCYECADTVYSDTECTSYRCNWDGDCPSGTVCNGSGLCTSAVSPPNQPITCSSPASCPATQTCGADSLCHANGDCLTFGCPTGFFCHTGSGPATCTTIPGPDLDGGDVTVKPPFTGCSSDAACAAGSKCLNGNCVVAADQCSDATQCATSGPNPSACVSGVCTPKCTASSDCPTGYSCDSTKGVCTGNPTPCGAGGQACNGGTTCVDEHCVPPCANNSCSAGLTCVDGGCIPNQAPQFTCTIEGGGTSSGCAAGSICLHHSCYIACSDGGDAGADAADAGSAGADSCKTADKFNVCKQVSTGTGKYSVCGSASNLGTDCDPTQGKACSAGLLCIDGFCR